LAIFCYSGLRIGKAETLRDVAGFIIHLTRPGHADNLC